MMNLLKMRIIRVPEIVYYLVRLLPYGKHTKSLKKLSLTLFLLGLSLEVACVQSNPMHRLINIIHGDPYPILQPGFREVYDYEAGTVIYYKVEVGKSASAGNAAKHSRPFARIRRIGPWQLVVDYDYGRDGRFDRDDIGTAIVYPRRYQLLVGTTNWKQYSYLWKGYEIYTLQQMLYALRVDGQDKIMFVYDEDGDREPEIVSYIDIHLLKPERMQSCTSTKEEVVNITTGKITIKSHEDAGS